METFAKWTEREIFIGVTAPIDKRIKNYFQTNLFLKNYIAVCKLIKLVFLLQFVMIKIFHVSCD